MLYYLKKYSILHWYERQIKRSKGKLERKIIMIVGIIGPSLSCKKIQADLSVISPKTETKLYIREASLEAIEVIQLCEEECDAVIFSGIATCIGVTSRYNMKKPYEYVVKDSTSLIKTFLDMQEEGFELDYFSVDVAEKNIIEDVFCEMEVSPKHMYSRPFGSCYEKEFIDWHLKLWKEKKIKSILTGFVWAYSYLKENKYPVFYLSTSRSAVRSAFEKLESRCALNAAHYSQMAVEIIRLTAASENEDNYYSNMLKKSKTENSIIEYAQQIQASFFSYGRYEYILFASKGCAENEENYRLLYKLQHSIAQIGFQFNAGIGTSLTAYQAERNARKALSQSLSTTENYIFLVNEKDKLLGPLGNQQQLEYELISTNSKIIEIAEKTEMSTVSISKLMSIIEMRKDAVFDAVQLADCLQISVRSARRILNRMTTAGYAKTVAKESSGAGRPKSLVEIHF